MFGIANLINHFDLGLIYASVAHFAKSTTSGVWLLTFKIVLPCVLLSCIIGISVLSMQKIGVCPGLVLSPPRNESL